MGPIKRLPGVKMVGKAHGKDGGLNRLGNNSVPIKSPAELIRMPTFKVY